MKCRALIDGIPFVEVEGEAEAVGEMKRWLESVGSPQSRIDKAVFTNERSITALSTDKFTVRH